MLAFIAQTKQNLHYNVHNANIMSQEPHAGVPHLRQGTKARATDLIVDSEENADRTNQEEREAIEEQRRLDKSKAFQREHKERDALDRAKLEHVDLTSITVLQERKVKAMKNLEASKAKAEKPIDPNFAAQQKEFFVRHAASYTKKATLDVMAVAGRLSDDSYFFNIHSLVEPTWYVNADGSHCFSWARKMLTGLLQFDRERTRTKAMKARRQQTPESELFVSKIDYEESDSDEEDHCPGIKAKRFIDNYAPMEMVAFHNLIGALNALEKIVESQQRTQPNPHCDDANFCKAMVKFLRMDNFDEDTARRLTKWIDNILNKITMEDFWSTPLSKARLTTVKESLEIMIIKMTGHEAGQNKQL